MTKCFSARVKLFLMASSLTLLLYDQVRRLTLLLAKSNFRSLSFRTVEDDLVEYRNQNQPNLERNSSHSDSKIQKANSFNQTKQEKPQRPAVIFDQSPPLPWTLPSLPTALLSSEEFMEEYMQWKHSLNVTLPWEKHKQDNDRLLMNGNSLNGTNNNRHQNYTRLPTPIFILNLPKSGTQTISEYFQCGRIESSHTYVGLNRMGDCFRDNLLKSQNTSTMTGQMRTPPLSTNHSYSLYPPLDGCTTGFRFYSSGRVQNRVIQVFSDIGTAYPGRCFYSTLHNGGLEHIATYYPNATILLLTRNESSWYDSIKIWNRGFLLNAWKKRCRFHGPMLQDGSRMDWIHFYQAHTHKIRNFAKSHVGMTYLELKLENAHQSIEYYTGVDKKCFRHCLPGVTEKNMCRPVETESGDESLNSTEVPGDGSNSSGSKLPLDFDEITD